MGRPLTESRGTGSLLTSYGYAPASNQLTSISLGGVLQQSLSYTPTGNLAGAYVGTSEVARAYYNSANRLEAPSGYGQILAEYGYDGFGRRLGKLIPGTKPTGTLFGYAQDGSLLEEADLTGSPKADYIYLDGMPIGDLSPASGALSYLHPDHLGTPQLATDSTQALDWGAAYDPFGSTNYLAGTITQNLRLPGMYFDAETQLYHNGFRDYAPTFGRYGETDPIGLGGGMNTYAYGDGNPIRFTDQFGEAVGVRLMPYPMIDGGSSDLGEAAAIFPYGVLNPILVLLANGPFHANCHGFTFLNGQYWVPPSQVPSLLALGGYVPVDDYTDVVPGDIAVYYDSDGDASHSGFIVAIDPIVIYGKNGTADPAFTIVGSPEDPYGTQRVQYYRPAGH